MADYATPSDVAEAWRPLDETEELAAQRAIEFHSAVIRQGVADIDDRIASGSLDPVIPRRIVINRVVHDLQAGQAERVQSRTNQLGPWTETERYFDDAGETSATLTDEELVLLVPRRRHGRAGSIRLGVGP